MKVGVIEAKTKLTLLIQAVENGETVTVCRNGAPVVDILRTKQRKRKPKLGTIKGIKINDCDWWKPMTDDEVEDLLGRR
jgi:antitoxin (DNA-binding transcriptional repressor) of toxin-antitoxin stability system